MKKHAPPRKQNRESPIQATVDPSSLALLPNTFEAGGQEVTQIGFSELKQGAAGLVIVTVNDIAPFLKEGEAISAGALAALTTTVVPDGTSSSLPRVQLRYPVQYQGTNEPILLQGSLIQLGKIPVQRVSGNSAKVDAIATQTLRVTLFRDLWPNSWAQLTKQPFREVLQTHPTLQLCRQEGCGDTCQRFHPPVDESIDQLIMDVWARAWHTLDGRFCPPEKAEFWSALVRVPFFAQLSIQQLSGSAGTFFEPRSCNGKESDSKYQVVWLPDTQFPDIIHKVKTTADAIAAVRVNKKYGIRFTKESVAAGFKLLRPTEVYIPIEVQKIWQLMPLPFGTQKAKLQNCITALPWTAKVLQQTGSSPVGTTWEVGSSSQPPTNVFMVDGQDVMITLLRDSGRAASSTDMVATSGTRDHLRGQKPSKALKLDPWLQSDPWAGALRTDLAQTKVEQVEARLKQNIDQATAAIRAEISSDSNAQSMDVSEDKTETEARFRRIETSLQEQQAHGEKLESWMHQIANTTSQMGAQVTQLHHGLTQQHDQVQALASEVNRTNDHMLEVRNEVKSEMEKGMAHITALLEKRFRSD